MENKDQNAVQSQEAQRLTKRERRELRRIEKQNMERMRARGRTSKRIAKWAAVFLVLGAAVYGIYYLGSRPTKPQLGQEIPILGRDHIAVGASHPPYNSNPPTSGSHYAQPAAWGVYQSQLPDEELVHNLEHGGIWISYRDVDQDTKSKLEAIGRKYPGSVVVEPRSQNDAKIALAAWGRLFKLDVFNEPQIIEFINSNRNHSPEPLAN